MFIQKRWLSEIKPMKDEILKKKKKERQCVKNLEGPNIVWKLIRAWDT